MTDTTAAPEDRYALMGSGEKCWVYDRVLCRPVTGIITSAAAHSEAQRLNRAIFSKPLIAPEASCPDCGGKGLVLRRSYPGNEIFPYPCETCGGGTEQNYQREETMPFDALRDSDDPGLPSLHPDRLAVSNAITTPRRPVLWRDPAKVRTAAALTLMMVVGGIVGGFVIAGALLNEAVLAFLGIGP